MNKFTSSAARRSSANRAFTLIEVAFSIGIIAFAMIPILGLLPVGIDVSRKAVDSTVASQIAQQLITQAEQTNFSAIQTLKGPVSSFDDQGNSTSLPNATYRAGFLVSGTTSLPTGVTTGRLATVTVCILATTASRTDTVSDPTLSRDSRRFTILIPDNGL